MGGKSSPAPEPAKTYSPMEQAQAQQVLNEQAQRAAAQQAQEQRNYEQQKLQEQRAREDQAAAAEATRQQTIAAQAEAEKQKALQGKRDQFNAYGTTGQAYGASKLGSLGFQDTYGVGAAYNNALKDWQTTKGANIDNYDGSAFDAAGTWDKVYGDTQTAERTKLQNGFSNMTNPGWQKNYFADSADDSILDAILGKQFTDATTQFDTAMKRGQLTDGAFSSASASLADKKLAAKSTLTDLGDGVLGGYRSQLTDEAKGYADKIGSWNLGNNFNLDNVTKGFQSTTDSLKGRMEGDIRRAVGDTQLFDTAKLLGLAGVTGGASNNPLQSAFTNAANTNDPETDKRTTGTVGVF